MSYQFKHYSAEGAPSSFSIYKIYKQNGDEIPMSEWTISGLAEAYEYTKNEGIKQRIGGRIYYINGNAIEGTDDKFYVYDTTNGLQSWLSWGGYGTAQGVTTNTLGSGKTNSATCLSSLGDTSDTIWYFIKNTMNSGSVGGCNDWYIGSTIENDLLRSSGLVTWFDSKEIWSSVESLYNPSSEANCWSYDNGCWGDDYYKDGTRR